MLHKAFGVVSALALLACPRNRPVAGAEVDVSRLKPLTDMGKDEDHHGFKGGLYPGVTNQRPAAHEAAGRALAKKVQPLDRAGKPSPDGKIVVLAIGFSNTFQSFMGFQRVAAADKGVNPGVVLVNGAIGGMPASVAQDEDGQRTLGKGPNRKVVKYWPAVNERLEAAAVSPKQVQVVWIKETNPTPHQGGFPKYTQTLQGQLVKIVQILPRRFPNVKLVYLSSRTWGGWAKVPQGRKGAQPGNSEPYSYETGFAVKWLIEQQVKGDKALNCDPKKGAVKAPWLSWGPYLWANGSNKRGDGFRFQKTDFREDDQMHHSGEGMKKIGNELLRFFKSDTTTRDWFASPKRLRGDSRTPLEQQRPCPGQREWHAGEPHGCPEGQWRLTHEGRRQATSGVRTAQVDEKPRRLVGPSLTQFLRSLQIGKVDPVGRSSASGEQSDEAHLAELLSEGDPLSPTPGRVAEDADTLQRLFEEAGESACFGLTPDGHLSSHQAIVFDLEVAVEQVVHLMEADIAVDDREEALAFTWLALAYHDHDHPADFGGLVRDASGDGKPKCCYVDVKGTRAASPGGQRTKLEQRAKERKFGVLAQTLTSAANNGFAGYPGRGKPGLLVTLLHNPVLGSKTHSGYALGWFFGISSNYQATAAVWGWGGALGVKLPEELQRRLASSWTTIRGQDRNLLELLREYRDYSQFRNDQGEWDRQSLRSTLLAMFLAARYLLMQEDPVAHAEQAAQNLQPDGVELKLSPVDFRPGESLATYYGRKADAAIRAKLEAEEEKLKIEKEKLKTEKEKLKAEEAQLKAEGALLEAQEALLEAEKEKLEAQEALLEAQEALLEAEKEKLEAQAGQLKAREALRKAEGQMVARRRQKGHSDAEIADDLGCTLEELLEHYPAQV